VVAHDEVSFLLWFFGLETARAAPVCVTGMALARPIHFISGSQESEPNQIQNRLQLLSAVIFFAKARLSKERLLPASFFDLRQHQAGVARNERWPYQPILNPLITDRKAFITIAKNLKKTEEKFAFGNISNQKHLCYE
jgi:hypothetical protein